MASQTSTFDIRLDSLMQVFSGLKNPYTGMGDPYVDPTQHTYIQPGLSRLSRQEQSALARQEGLLRKLVSNLPLAATWQWGQPTLTKGSADLLQEIADAVNNIPVETLLQEIGTTSKGFQSAGELCLQTGNSAFIKDVDDGRKLDEPLDLNNIKKIKRLVLLSRHAITPDLTNLSKGLPQHYRIINAYGSQDFSSGQLIHRSRVHWFRGVPILDDYDLIANNGCDDSIFESVRDAWYLYKPAVEAAGRMLIGFDVITHEIEDLAQNLADRGDEYAAEVAARIRLNQISRSSYHTYVIDKTKEALGNSTYQVSGMSDLFDRVKDNLQGSVNITRAVAFGDFASGLDASGKSTSETKQWNQAASQFQVDKYNNHILDLQKLVCLCKSGPTKGDLPDGLGWKWLPPFPTSPEEQAELELQRAQLIQDLNGVDPRFGKVAIAATYGQKEYNSTITLPKPYADALQRDIKEEAKPQPTEPDVSALQGGEQPSADAPQDETQPSKDEQAQQDQSIADDILSDRTLLDSADSPIDIAYAKYHAAVNMSASELEAWSKTRWSKMASVDRAPIQRNLRLLQKPKAQWTQADATQALRTVSFIARMRGAGKGEPVNADAPAWMTKKLISLRNWSYDPRKPVRRDSGDIHFDASTYKDLQKRATAKNATMPPGKKQRIFGASRQALETFLGEGGDASTTATKQAAEQPTGKRSAKAQPTTGKAGKYQTSKTSSAIASAIAKKTGADPEAIEKDLRGKIQKAIDKTRREAKKAGKEVSEKELRAAARAVVKVEAKSAIAAARGEGKPAATPANAEPLPAKKVKATGEKKAKQVKAEPEAEASGKVKKARSAKPKASDGATDKPVAETKAEKPSKAKVAKEKPVETAKTESAKVATETKVESKQAEQKSASKTADPVKTNQAALDSQRKKLVEEAGEKTVAEAEQAVKNILNSKETGVYVKVGSNDTLARIIGDRFRNSVELGTEASVPGLEGSYQDARKRVEKETMGYDTNHDPSQRPIYAYYGSQNLKSPTHEDTAPFGEVTIKLKDDVKQRSTFTGADSFKSGIASKVDSPNAASLIQSTKHGKAIDSVGAKDTLETVGKAKNVDDLFNVLPTDGGKYIEAQIHGQVRPEDIAELHYDSRAEVPIPSAAVREWAAKNGVKIYQNGKPYEHLEVSEKRRKEIADTITPEVFKEYVMAKALRGRQEDASATHNLTLDEWKAKTENQAKQDSYYQMLLKSATKPDGSVDKFNQRLADKYLAGRLSTSNYTSEIQSAVEDGYTLPDHVANQLPSKGSGAFKKKELAAVLGLSKSNRDKMAGSQQLHKEIDAILDGSFLSEDETKAYKPKMSEAEAKAYTRDSAVSGINFYHGGPKEAIDSITSGGVKISANNTGMFGGGFYMGAAEGIGQWYAGNPENRYIAATVKMKNPAVFETAEDFFNQTREKFGKEGSTENESSDFIDALGGRFGDPKTGKWTALLKLKGYDGIYIKDSAYMIAMQREQVVAYDVRTGKDTSAIDNKDYLSANVEGSTLAQNKQFQDLSKRLKNTNL